MPRNVDKDTRDETERRARILDAGLDLFSRHGIENVSMQAVADRAGVGGTTLFKYYRTKARLVSAVSGRMWKSLIAEALSGISPEQLSAYTAYELIQLYTECILRLYLRQPRALGFSSDYKTFICRQHVPAEELSEHLLALEPLKTVFHAAYLRALDDRSIRTDVTEEKLFTTVGIGMLAIAERYVQGIVWAEYSPHSHIDELRHMQRMILVWCREGVSHE